MRILGIDQSFTHCAYVIISSGTVESFGVISTNKSDDIFKRTWDIAQALMRVTLDTPIDEVHIEGLAFSMRGNATRDLAGLQFTLVCALRFISEISSVVVVAPTSAKKYATGSGKADKAMMVNALPAPIRERFEKVGFTMKSGLSDLADAYWIARTGEGVTSSECDGKPCPASH